jgi:hypothetical protein
MARTYGNLFEQVYSFEALHAAYRRARLSKRDQQEVQRFEQDLEGNLIELQFGQGRNWPLGAALSITLLVIVMVALLFYVRNASKGGVQSHG